MDALNIYAKLGLVKEQCRVIVFTAYPSYENCVNAVKAGAYAYIPKLEQPDGSGGGMDGCPGLPERAVRGRAGDLDGAKS